MLVDVGVSKDSLVLTLLHAGQAFEVQRPR
jgi:hypothetical protein